MQFINFKLIDKIDNNGRMFLNNANKKKVNRQQLSLNAIQTNLFQISQFLDQQSQVSLLMTCRLFQYTFISRDIWQGIKYAVAEKKVQFYQDIDFVEQQPLKNINKEERKIRIHSLKKNSINNNKKIRDPSNVKSKAFHMLNQQMLFRNTEIGFKKLVKPQSSSLIQRPLAVRPSLRKNFDRNKDIIDKIQTSDKHKPCENTQKQQSRISYKYLFQLIELPSQYTEKDLIIKVNDPWHINMNRANNLISILKRWNQFHIKKKSLFEGDVMQYKKTQDFCQESFKGLIKFVKQVTEFQKMANEYRRIFYQSVNLSYRQIVQSIEGAKNSLLIDQNLNKVAKKFLEYHQQFIVISEQIGSFIENLKNISRKFSKIINNIGTQQLQQLDSTLSSQFDDKFKNKITLADNDTFSVAQFLNCLDDSIGILLTLVQQKPTILKGTLSRLVLIFDSLVQSLSLRKVHKVILSKISFNTICQHAQDFQVILQLFNSAYTKLVKLATSFEQQNIVLAMVINKSKSMRQITAQLWNVAKYFNKLKKQVDKAEKKSSQKDVQKLKMIQDFLKLYSGFRTQFQILNYKNVHRLEKQMSIFKQKVANLKNMIQNND